MKAEQKKLREDKKALSKSLRNAEKRRSRLKQRAKALTDADLLAVISLRNHEKALSGKVVAESEGGSDGDDQTEASTSPTSASAKASPKKKGRHT